MSSNYELGRRYEYEVMELFRKAGYEITRTAGSHGTFDLIARKQTRTGTTYETWIAVYLQCKRRGGKRGKKAK